LRWHRFIARELPSEMAMPVKHKLLVCEFGISYTRSLAASDLRVQDKVQALPNFHHVANRKIRATDERNTELKEDPITSLRGG